jgi:hypothetical protein
MDDAARLSECNHQRSQIRHLRRYNFAAVSIPLSGLRSIKSRCSQEPRGQIFGTTRAGGTRAFVAFFGRGKRFS